MIRVFLASLIALAASGPCAAGPRKGASPLPITRSVVAAYRVPQWAISGHVPSKILPGGMVVETSGVEFPSADAVSQQDVLSNLSGIEGVVSVALASSDPLSGRSASARAFDREADEGGVAGVAAAGAVVDGRKVPLSPSVLKTNDLIDPKNLEPLLRYDPATWTSEISLHAHSRFSDGEFSPTQLAQKLHKAGLRHVALTDHDNVQGQEEFVQAARELGLFVHTGIELTGGPGTHIVVLDFDIYDAKLAALIERIGVWRFVRAKAYIAHLNALPELKDKGVVITIEEVLAKTVNGQIERPEIAAVLVDKGIVKTKAEAFSPRFIGFPMKDPEVLKLEPKPEEVMEAVRSSGGKAFLAHPYTVAPDGPSVRQLLAMGMHGVEVYRAEKGATPLEEDQLQGQMRSYLLSAHDMGLLVMSGADFHGPSLLSLNHLSVPMPKTLAGQLLEALEAPNRAALAKIDAKRRVGSLQLENEARRARPWGRYAAILLIVLTLGGILVGVYGGFLEAFSQAVPPDVLSETPPEGLGSATNVDIERIFE